jgi:hypothetical protein
LAVAAIVIVTGAGPQSKVMIPPAATALTTAAEVQLAFVPAPTTRVGCEVSTGPASAGTPGMVRGGAGTLAVVRRGAAGIGLAAGSLGIVRIGAALVALVGATVVAGSAAFRAAGCWRADPHELSTPAATSVPTSAATVVAHAEPYRRPRARLVGCGWRAASRWFGTGRC